MNHYEPRREKTADDYSPDQQAKGWPYINWKDLFDRLAPEQPPRVRRTELTSHLVHRDQGPNTRDDIATLIDGAIEDDVLVEHADGDRVELYTEQQILGQVEIDEESTLTLAHDVPPKL